MDENSDSKLRARLIIGLVLSLLLIIALLILETFFRPFASDHLYFQAWTSERMMQTTSIEDLRDEPFATLWYLHIQPPAFDSIRAVLALVWRSDNSFTMLAQVDRSLYVLWAVVYGTTSFVLFWWVAEVTTTWFALVSTLIFAIHPAYIFYATLLDTTLLSTFLILCLCYFLWRIMQRLEVPGHVLALSFVALFLTRSIFQWPWLLVLGTSLALMRFPKRSLFVFLLIAGTIVGLYTFKQLYLFGMPTTSSFTGFNLSRSIGYVEANARYSGDMISTPESVAQMPRVLTRERKIDGSINYNNEQYLVIDRDLQLEYRKLLLTSSPLKLARDYATNLGIYLLPSSQYTEHVIVDRLPYRPFYDTLFSFPVLPILMSFAVLLWLFFGDKSNLSAVLGLCLPVVFIVLLSIAGERGENMRFKFFLEPVMFVFLVSQVYRASMKMLKWIRKANIPSSLPTT